MDDLTETVLMRMVRGTTFSGYSGINDVSSMKGVSVIRPFLYVSKEEIKEYAKASNIEYMEDESNSEDIYTRNRYRHNIIPKLKEENPRLNDKIVQFANNIKYAYKLISKLAIEYINNNVDKYDLSFTVSSFSKLERIIQEDVIKKMINTLTNNEVELTYEKLSSIMNLIESDGSNKKVLIKKNYYVLKEYDNIYFVKLEDKDLSFNIEINEVGEYILPTNDKIIVSNDIISLNNCIIYKLCYNDFNCVFPIIVRTKIDGDKIVINNQTKKVKDLLINQKIPSRVRQTLPIVLNNKKEIIFIPKVVRKPNEIKEGKTLYIYYVDGGKIC